MSNWKKFELQTYCPLRSPEPPFDGRSFIACIWGEWVGQAVYSRHYDAGDRRPGKYEFFYVTQNPENDGWEIRLETDPFPITHWMPLPKRPE